MLRSLVPTCALTTAIVLSLAGCVPPDSAASARETVLPAPQQGMPSDGLGPDDGFVPVGERIDLADDVPAITNLDPALRAALEAAAADAAEREVVFTFTDAWRSARYQQQLFDDAVLHYGSEAEARRWVKPADESAHVSGRAVDVATADAMDWLSRFGSAYGLCQIYANEAWHYEHVDADTGCPAQLTDSSVG